MPTPNGILNPNAAPIATNALAAWLAPIRRSGSARRLDDPLPFTIITKIGGTEDPGCECAEPLMSLHTLSNKDLGYANAENEAEDTHRAMTQLARWVSPITLPDGTQVALDYVLIKQLPVPVEYDEVGVLRWVSRYSLGICYTYIGSVSTS